MISLFSRKNTYLIIGGLASYHLLIGVLFAFWIGRFLVQSYDPSVFLLLALFSGITILCDILVWKAQVIHMFLVRCRVDNIGIHCHMLGLKKWSILWSDIRIFGVAGHADSTQARILFFDSNNKAAIQHKSLHYVTDKHIIFEFDASKWALLSCHMPDGMRKKLQYALDRGRDCYHRC